MQTQELQWPTKFKILQCIAVGGMGSVYLAQQLGANGFTKTVAIKTINPTLVSDKETLEMFIGEAKLVADLIHENIVQVYQFEENQGLYYLVMEYACGPNLEVFMRRLAFLQKKIPAELGAFVISQIARGLSYIHKKRDKNGNRLKIVHRDISPSNIIITHQGVVKLTDFGIAKALITKVPDEHQVLMGKYPYMSPEQAHFEVTDFRSDIFSLGLVGYELLTGKPVYDAKEEEQILRAMQNPITPPKTWNSAIPSILEQIILKALEKNPEDRFQSANEIRDAIDTFLYKRGSMPTSEKLSQYVELLFPEAKRNASF